MRPLWEIALDILIGSLLLLLIANSYAFSQRDPRAHWPATVFATPSRVIR